MSERMIEIQRARLLAAGKGNSNVATASNGSAAGGSASGAHPALASTALGSQAAGSVRQTPQQAAATAMLQEDQHLLRFLQRLQEREESSGSGGPTVPTALSRRLLHRQGAGFLDESVSAVASAAADRFLATILQQAIACRDQRLKGAEMVREAARHRKRHAEQFEADADDRRRRRKEHDELRESSNLATIQAADSVKRASKAGTSETEGGPTNSKKKKKIEDSLVNGFKIKRKKIDDEEEASYDSIDEENEYYQAYYGGSADEVSSDEEEDNEMLILRDVARPLETWNFHVAGKLGTDPAFDEEDKLDDNGLERPEFALNEEAQINNFDIAVNEEITGAGDGSKATIFTKGTEDSFVKGKQTVANSKLSSSPSAGGASQTKSGSPSKSFEDG
jgi:hypothetical protein